MTHAEEVARLRDAVVEAAKAQDNAFSGMAHHWARASRNTEAAARALIAAEALTCETCRGGGSVWVGHYGERIYSEDGRECPACHGTGRKPDTFSDDGATTPEIEDERQGEVPGA